MKNSLLNIRKKEIERLAGQEQVAKVYISTNYIGLYEKYGCEYSTQMKDMDGETSRIYVKRINATQSSRKN